MGRPVYLVVEEGVLLSQHFEQFKKIKFDKYIICLANDQLLR